MVVANIGILYDWPAAYTPNAGPHDAFVLVQLQQRHGKSAAAYADTLRRTLPRDVPGVQFAFDTGGLVSSALNFGLPSPIDIQVEGPKLETAHQIAQVLRDHVALVPGAVDVRIQQSLDYPQIKLDVDRDRVAAVGLTQQAVVQNVITALNSSTTFLPSFWIDQSNGNHYFIGATYREKNINSRETLENIPITDKGQSTPIPLRNLATMGTGKAVVEADHVNIRRVTDLYANVQGRDVGSVAGEVQRILARLQLPAGYSAHMRGEVSSMRESFGSLGFGLALAVILVYLLLVAEFRSFVDPFIVMFSVPPGLIGVALILWLTGTTLNIQSLLGVIMVVGLTVSYSVLIVDFANRRLEEGAAPREAVMEAASVRLRPIVMTSLAAILGLVPMALRSGEANMPLARAVIGGLLVSTVVKLFLLPILYSYLRRSAPPAEAEAI
jgi:multidrug efflux pump subunit AcrB